MALFWKEKYCNPIVIFCGVIIMLMALTMVVDAANVNLPKKKVTVYNTKIGYQYSPMATMKTIQFPSYQRIGAIVGDIINLKALMTPPQAVPDSKLVWSGIQSGVGPDVSVNINNTGGGVETLTIADKGKVMAIISAFDVSGPTENEWSATHPVAAAVIYFSIRSAAETWAASANAMYNWGDNFLHNGKADAARHSYWNVLMAFNIFVGPTLAQEAGFAHERTNLDEGGPHNETVMDLTNNMKGLSIAASLPSNASEADQQGAIVNAINSGGLMILDDLDNIDRSRLLQPSNR